MRNEALSDIARLLEIFGHHIYDESSSLSNENIWEKELIGPLKPILEDLNKKSKYLSIDTLIEIKECLSKLDTGLLNFKTQTIVEGSDLSSLKQQITRIKYLLNSRYEFYYGYTYSIDDIKVLTEILKSRIIKERINFPNVIDETINKIINNNKVSVDLNYLAEIIIKTINSTIGVYKEEASIQIRGFYNEIKALALTLEQDRFQQKTEEITEQVDETFRKLNLEQNIGLITLFDSEAKKYSPRIKLYTRFIIILFCLISVSILLKLFTAKNNFELHNFMLFLAFITSLSAFLAFLLRERSRLYNLETYCRKNYLELSALPPYMAGLNEEQSQKLKIDLSNRYFRGHDNIENNNEQSSQILVLTDIVKSLIENNTKK
ncbi:hypothetical protein [Acinetobacter lwoffii]|uniref:hypothetical protein n=1 Tax=Acinetobacter lwoffii TaxID=28090 RepID=UPI001486D9CD|nr:hypothetical protein [Acinetobacter lwoffii]